MSLSKELEVAVVDLQKRVKLLERDATDKAEMALTISNLRNEIEFLKSKIAATELAQRLPTPAVVEDKPKGRSDGVGRVFEERGATISNPEPVISNRLTRSELRHALQIVSGRHSCFADVDLQQFIDAVTFIVTCSYRDDLDTDHYLSHWMDEAGSSTHNREIDGKAIIAAAIACGVSYSDTLTVSGKRTTAVRVRWPIDGSDSRLGQRVAGQGSEQHECCEGGELGHRPTSRMSHT
jgi:hypothetical protein